MTREEAIEKVEMAFAEWENEFSVSGDDWSEEHEALDMVVKALKQESMLDKVKKAREKIDKMSKYTSVTGVVQYTQVNREDILEIMDELIESVME